MKRTAGSPVADELRAAELRALEAPPSPHQVELIGLGVMTTVMERMSPAERRRALAYLTDRYAEAKP